MKQAFCLAIFMILISLTGCSKQKESSDKPKEEQAIPVSSMHTETERLCYTLKVLGEIQPEAAIAVYSKVNGKLFEYAVKSGSKIKKGDLIASIDRDEIGYKYQVAPVISPISGVVSSLPLGNGSEVRGETAVGYIVNIDPVKVVFSLPDRYRSLVKVGQQVSIETDRGIFLGEINEIDPLIDITSHAFSLKVRIENPEHQLIPGMFVKGEIILNTFDQALMIPEEAILPMRGEWFVYTISSGQAILKKVVLGLRQAGKVQIVDGIRPGDEVILGGNHKVSEGKKVRQKVL